MSFGATCVGGPYADQEYAHLHSSWVVVQPAMIGADILCRDPDELEITALPMGKYVLDESGKYWLWEGYSP